jgi:formamidopyrimidine-DNA glycosylase
LGASGYIDGQTRRHIYDQINKVMRTARERQAIPADFPDTYLIPHRDEGVPCPGCDGQVEKIKVSGRSGYYCPQYQRKPASSLSKAARNTKVSRS